MIQIGNPTQILKLIFDDIRYLTHKLFSFLNLNDKSYYINPKDYGVQEEK